MNVPVLRVDDRDPQITELRRRLAALGLADGESVEPELFDEGLGRAVREFQQQRGLNVDGVVGPDTQRALEATRWRLGDRILSHRAGSALVGDDVAELQSRLMSLGFPIRKVDGLHGPDTDAGVRAFQRASGLAADGIVGPDTLRALTGLRRAVAGGAPNSLRERDALHGTGGRLGGRVIVLDPGHAGPADARIDQPSAWAMLDIARRLEGRLTAIGVTVVFTHTEAHWPTDGERAELANSVSADLAVSLYCDRSESTSASGVSAYYYGTERPGSASAVGHALADVVVREIAARTGLTDLRSHARAWSFLARTAMPAVRIDIGYVSNTDDATRLADPAVRDAVAEAVAVGIQRTYLGERDNAETGVLDLSALRAMI